MRLFEGLILNFLRLVLVVDVVELLLESLLARLELAPHLLHIGGHLGEHLTHLSFPVRLDAADFHELVPHPQDKSSELPPVVFCFLQTLLELCKLRPVLTLFLGLGSDQALDSVELLFELHGHSLLVDVDEPPRHCELLLQRTHLLGHGFELVDVRELPTLFDAQLALQTGDLLRAGLDGLLELLLSRDLAFPQVQALVDPVLEH